MPPFRRSSWPLGALVVIAAVCVLPTAPVRATRAQEHVFVTVLDANGKEIGRLTPAISPQEFLAAAHELVDGKLTGAAAP